MLTTHIFYDKTITMTSLLIEAVPSPGGHLILISCLFWLTWGFSLFLKGWVSDDIEGISKFSDYFYQQKDQRGNVVKEELVDYYDELVGQDKVRYKHTQFNPHIGFPGSVLRYLRLIWGRSFKQIGKNSKGHEVYGWVQSAFKHHLLNLIFQQANLILGYFLISKISSPEIAFFSMLIFAAHPVCVQAVAWISGVNYSASLTFALSSLVIAQNIQNPYIELPLVSIATVISCLFFLPACFTWIPMFFIGELNAGIFSLIIGMGIFFGQGIGVYKLRKGNFEKQSMGKSTNFYWRKVIIAFKTIFYYTHLIPFPKRLGLFASWGYHFEDTINYIDKLFWAGVASTALLAYFFFTGAFVVKFAVLWLFVYIIMFLNLITAQQFVSERYAYISSFGFCILLAVLLHEVPVILAFIVGLYVMRVWFHLPTFKNEVRFYESNAFNFPDSEVALGNLGVAYLNHGLPGKAVDTWMEATRINQNYDVPWYNLYSFAKQQGDLLGARNFLFKCLQVKQCHFREQWTKELEQLDAVIQRAQQPCQPQPATTSPVLSPQETKPTQNSPTS